MTHRIILFSLLVTNSFLIIAMDDGVNPFAPNALRNASEQSMQKAIATGEKQFQAGSASDEREKISQMLAPYQRQVKIVQNHAACILDAYRVYLTDQANNECEKAKSQRSFDQYKALLEAFKVDRNILYNSYWSGSYVKLYTSHPEFNELCVKVNFAHDETKEIESGIDHKKRQELYRADLLLSIPMNALCETLTTLKSIQSLSK